MGSSGAEQEKPTLTPRGAGYQVTYRGRPLYSRRDPVAGAQRRAEAVELESRTLYLLPSPLLGYGLETLHSRLPETSRILSIEIDASLAALSQHHLPEELISGPGIITLLSPSDHELESALRAFHPRQFRRVRLVTLSGGYALHSTRYRKIADYAQNEIQRQWQNVLTEVKLGRRWVRNLLRNLCLLAQGTDAAALRVETPVVVVGAGPSLEAAIPELRQLRHGITLLAVDTAAAPLLSAGIHPDLIISLDGQWANLQDFVGVEGGPRGARTPNFTLVAELATFPGAARIRSRGVTTEQGRGPYLFSTEFAPLRLFERLDRAGLRPLALPPRGSVGVTAVELALRITRHEVFVCGLDLCFDALKTHAPGSTIPRWHHRSSTRLDPLPVWRLSHRHGLLTRPDKTGSPTTTTAVLLSYASQLREIAAAEEAMARLYDLSIGGLDLGLAQVDFRSLEQAAVRAAARGRDRSGGSQEQDQPDPPGPSSTPASRAASIDAFLAAELKLLGRLEELTRRYMDPSSADANSGAEELFEQIEECDYVWLHFPDTPSTEPHFLARLLPAIGEYRALIRELRARISLGN